MNAQAKYQALQNELAAIEKATGAYLADECVDHENCPKEIRAMLYHGFAPEEYWIEMHRQACSAAGFRAEEADIDINALMGRIIY